MRTHKWESVGISLIHSCASVSTGQKSETANVRKDHLSPLFRQSDSPSPYQFQFDRFDGRISVSVCQPKPHKHQLTGQPTRSLEPILFPKLRI
ncbi:unnamed protein product [Heligmosomoides polygyrus]|uniref:Secreted protein n=1 Tax=Heligmosomoides polygyrus TaxID=6339 RepID=A0A183F237_HELPZ|nr:unnamed protein product [Heligmosomoides polygyrus]